MCSTAGNRQKCQTKHNPQEGAKNQPTEEEEEVEEEKKRRKR